MKITDPIVFSVDDPLFRSAEFHNFFTQWKIKNGGSSLTSTPEEQKRGAFHEFVYIKRGAVDDDRKYCDVALLDGFGVLSNKIIDVKSVIVKFSKQKLFDKIKDNCLGKAAWYRGLQIDEVHYWAAFQGSFISTPWFRFVLEDLSFKMEFDY
jgi:hypothetical protein